LQPLGEGGGVSLLVAVGEAPDVIVLVYDSVERAEEEFASDFADVSPKVAFNVREGNVIFNANVRPPPDQVSELEEILEDLRSR
jgi:hypothetical protein